MGDVCECRKRRASSPPPARQRPPTCEVALCRVLSHELEGSRPEALQRLLVLLLGDLGALAAGPEALVLRLRGVCGGGEGR